jgi:hypothetical protein
VVRRSYRHAVGSPATDTDSLLDDSTRPYFSGGRKVTCGQLKEYLASSDPEDRTYWMGALLCEANTLDVWLFVTPHQLSGTSHSFIYMRRVTKKEVENQAPTTVRP